MHFHAQFTALNTSRSVKTRRLANAEENTELTKTAKLAQELKLLYKNQVSDRFCYNRKKNIITGQYKGVDGFEDDFLRLFENAEIIKTDEDDEVIRCICNIYKDEGLMIQCEKCFVWQHCDCVGVDGKVEKYLCEQCSGDPCSSRPHYANPECQYYLTMLLGDLQIKLGDCVYLRREDASLAFTEGVQSQILPQGMESGDAAARDSLRNKKTQLLDIFRVERLWKDEQNKKWVFGHHYLRPHETYHEASRKFFSNEIFQLTAKDGLRDLRRRTYTYVNIVWIKQLIFFYKISKIKYPVCTKKYAFEHFDKRRNPKRTFWLPHTVPSAYCKKSEKATEKKLKKSDGNQKEKKRGTSKDIDTRLEESPESREQKRTRLNELLLQLLSAMPCKQTVDLSYLLEGGLGKRIRRKAILS
ncbi:histone-lysine N-methyltransferase ASH1L [Caerostris extrusa]|uniref:Histone-lysine N-methyltransferase ASH1L n=1 Tax=Caerostris extrusa TaxID=172846 RepID=A0AAV4UFI1_CAEEX|nr:histone-lysine N-methyltransferase ASH1L [Caerostris extrusa]